VRWEAQSTLAQRADFIARGEHPLESAPLSQTQINWECNTHNPTARIHAWCGDRFTAAEKADTFATINQWFEAYKTSPDIYDKDGPVFSNYFGGHLLGFGVAGLATAGENPRGREIADYMRARFEQVKGAFTSGVFAGGYPLEAYTYGTNHFVRILEYAAAVRTATGEDLLGANTANKIVRSLGSSVPAIDYRLRLPLFYNSPGDEHLYTRSSWSHDAVWASFKASAQHLGSIGDVHAHDMRGAGHISIQRGNDYLLVNSGQWKGQDGWGGNPSAYDLQGASSLRSFVRSFVSLGNGNFLLSDRVHANNATDQKLYFHFNRNGIPQISGNVVTSTVGDSRLFVKTVLPAQAIIRVVPDPVSDTDPTPITYRTEVSDSVASQDLTALHIISATARTVTDMPDTGPILVPARNMFEAAIMTATPKFVLFAASAAPQTIVTYSTAKGGLHLLLDMVPNKTLVVDLDGAMLKSVKVSSQGVASFNAPSGGVFRVEEPSSKTTRQAVPAGPRSAR
jgi:hypothetical protein